jgi:hypothetical protein
MINLLIDNRLRRLDISFRPAVLVDVGGTVPPKGKTAYTRGDIMTAKQLDEMLRFEENYEFYIDKGYIVGYYADDNIIDYIVR